MGDEDEGATNPGQVEPAASAGPGPRRVRDATLADWYARRRVTGAPTEPAGLLALADHIYQEDFKDLGREEDRPDFYVWCGLVEAFRDFDPARGDQAVSAQARFAGFFRHLFRRRLTRESEHIRRRRQRENGRPAPAGRPDDDVAAAYDSWSRRLLDVAMPRLDPRAAAVLHARLDGRRLADVAAELGVARKTLSNRYGGHRLVGLVRSAVQAVVLGLPAGTRCRLVAHMRVECGLAEGQVSRLLCVPPGGLADAFAAVDAGAVRVPDEDQAHALLVPRPGPDAERRRLPDENREVCGRGMPIAL